jgi:DNA topoisomerase-2
MTSSNYNDDQEKVTGGRNGFGAKLTNIFSTKFVIRTGDKEKGKVYEQVFENNMGKKSAPKIMEKKTEDFTEVTFYPDFPKFGMTSLDPDIVSLMKKRVYDLAGVTPRSVRVFLNDERLEIKDFREYC